MQIALTLSIIGNIYLVYNIVDLSTTLAHQNQSLKVYMQKYQTLSEVFLSFNQNVEINEFLEKTEEKSKTHLFKRYDNGNNQVDFAIDQTIFKFSSGRLVKIE